MARAKIKVNDEWKDFTLPPGGDTLPIGTIVEIPDDMEIPYGYEEIPNPDKYSEEEVDTGKVWIDPATGEKYPIYRKVISGNTPEPDVNGASWYNIVDNVQDLINVYGNIGQRPYNYNMVARSNGTYNLAFDIVVDSNILKYRNLGISSNQPYKIVVEYAKQQIEEE